jgi:polyisoprenoid-binding protein YceI
VAFTVRHMMVSKVRGHFTKVEADIVLAPNPLDSSATATIDPNSIDTNNPHPRRRPALGQLLRGRQVPDDQLPLDGVRHTQDGFDLDGELTIHGVTRPVTLALDVHGFTKDPYGGFQAGFSATGEIDRKDFNITTNIPMDGGGVVIGDTIQLFIEVEAILQQPAQT